MVELSEQICELNLIDTLMLKQSTLTKIIDAL